MPFIEEILLTIGESEHLFSSDLRWGYHQIGVVDESILKAECITTKEKYEFLRICFALVQAPDKFQK